MTKYMNVQLIVVIINRNNRRQTNTIFHNIHVKFMKYIYKKNGYKHFQGNIFTLHLWSAFYKYYKNRWNRDIGPFR